jgi:hypothetical protein
MFKGLLLYWLNPNRYQLDAQDKEMTNAYNHFVQKLREKNPKLSAQFESDADFIEEAKRHPSGGNRFSPAIGPLFWYTQDATMDIELINRNMETIYMPNIDTDVDPNIRGLCIGLNDGDDTANLANPDYYREYLAEYLPSDFPFEKYVGAYSMTEY